MPLIQTTSIILQVFAYGETSKILRLSTPSHGVLSVMARGARRPRSPYGGLLEPFTLGTATMMLKAGRELQTLSGFELGRSGHSLGRDLVRFASASLLAELVLRAGEAGMDPGLFELLDHALERLAAAPPGAVEGEGLAQAWLLVGRLGYSPVLDVCIGCGRELMETEDGTFDHLGGGARCVACGAGGRGRSLPAAARQALQRLCTGEAVELARTAAHWQLLGNFLSHHVIEAGSLKSLGVLVSAIEAR
jgi:DNA repair protein RecO (recombination protein O)